jgi:hypothetical protein
MFPDFARGLWDGRRHEFYEAALPNPPVSAVTNLVSPASHPSGYNDPDTGRNLGAMGIAPT